MSSSSRRAYTSWFALLVLAIPCAETLATNYNFALSAEAEQINQQISSADPGIEDVDSKNQQYKLSGSYTLNGKNTNFFVRSTYNVVERELNEADGKSEYTEYSYLGASKLIDNLLTLNISGSQYYRVPSINAFQINDFLLDSGSLSKISNNSAQLNFNVRRNDYIGASIVSSYDRLSSDQVSPSNPLVTTNFENDAYGVRVRLVTGKAVTGFVSRFSGDINYTKRADRNDFLSQIFDLSNEVKINKQTAFVVSANYERSEIKNDSDTFDNLREFSSTGIGILWQPNVNRSLELLWNRSETTATDASQDDETNTYLSLAINWAFSPRTLLQASFDRRFFGDAANIRLQHSLRNWRSSFTYTENVSTNSRLITSQQTGAFVCPNGTSDISQCSIPDTLNPVLAAGETLVPFAVPIFELNDNIVLRKSYILQTNVSKRRTNLSLGASKNEDNESEIGRITDSESLNATLSFNLSARSTLSLRHSTTDIEEAIAASVSTSKVSQTELTFKRQLTRRFSLALEYQKLKREGRLSRNSFSGLLQGPGTDNRISLLVSYNYALRN